MPRRFSTDGDNSRLPDGMTRVAYDADTQIYTFRDAADGSLWESPPGCEYGHMTRVAGAPKLPSVEIDIEAGPDHHHHDADANDDDAPPSYDESESAIPFLDHTAYTSREDQQGQRRYGLWGGGAGGNSMARHWRSELMPLLNFFMILALFLIGLFWFLGWMTSSHNLSTCPPGSHAHQIQKQETCWSIAQMHEIEVDQLRDANEGIDCDLLRVGGMICVPAMPKV